MRGDHKVVASAQKRVGNVLLQHGSIKLNGVASHAALTETYSETAADPPPMTVAEFEHLAGVFQESMADELQLVVVPEVVSAADTVRLKVRRDLLKKNPLLRRQIIKQTDPANSL